MSREREILRAVRVERDLAVLEAERCAETVAELKQRVAELRRELDCVYSGRSWRLTRPLRWLLAGMKQRGSVPSAGANDEALDDRQFGESRDVDRERELASMIDGPEGDVGADEREA